MVLKSAISILCLMICATHVARADPIHDAARAGNIPQLELLLAQGADVNQRSTLATPLYYAIKAEHAEAAAFLIEHGADVNASTTWGAPLHAAAANGMTDTAALLLDGGADPNVRWQELTPLHIAARNGKIDVVRVLLDRGADINASSQMDEPALHLAIIFGHQDVADLLRERGTKAPAVEDVEPLIASADPAHGFEVALRCRNCHSVDREAKVLNGPPLWNIVGRPKASFTGYKYSPALQALSGNWTYADLNEYIAHPAWAWP